ncbi:MAG: glycosyltransferase family 39 protein [Bacteroidetes bacterium]|nr:glycosyltransferase family 39 protein [Bacteroidota bacterium]MDA1121520.1 glycosyltransferase family 39 protein [Bacteroidota bacterium]
MTFKWPDPLYPLFGIIVIVYCLNIDGNAIWTTHEAYYAESVREMHESGEYFEFFFNYEPRFQKPPMTYWIMAASSAIFGINEFGLRLPFVLMSLATIYLVFAIGNLIYNKKTGIYSMLIFSVSLQFIWFKHYASPEIPLTFFFTLAAILFLLGSKTSNKTTLISSYVAIGLAALTKGFPYLLIFFLIIIAWRILKRDSNILQIIKSNRLIEGAIISSIIGLSWLIYMTVIHGTGFTDVLISETFGRVFNHPDDRDFLQDLFYYPEVIAWGFYPFSLLFFASLFLIRNKKRVEDISFLLSWILVFLSIFTFSDGKLPIYLLQAFPAFSIICGYLVDSSYPITRRNQIFFDAASIIPTIISITAGLFLIYAFNLRINWLISISIGLLSILVIMLAYHKKLYKPIVINWLSALIFCTILFIGVLPAIEIYRPYSTFEAVLSKYQQDIPLFIENRFLDNMPYYSARKVFGGLHWTREKIFDQTGPKIVLLNGIYKGIEGQEILWQGLIHGYGAEDHFLKFIRDCHSLQNGDSSKFLNYTLIYKPG